MNSDFQKLSPEERDARITALLLGELSVDEANDLRAAIAADAELTRAFERRKETIELLRATVADEAQIPADAPTRLARERREKLLNSFKTSAQPKPRKLREFLRRAKTFAPLAAAAVAILSLIAATMLPSLAKARARARRVTPLPAFGFTTEFASSESLKEERGRQPLDTGLVPSKSATLSSAFIKSQSGRESGTITVNDSGYAFSDSDVNGLAEKKSDLNRQVYPGVVLPSASDGLAANFESSGGITVQSQNLGMLGANEPDLRRADNSGLPNNVASVNGFGYASSFSSSAANVSPLPNNSAPEGSATFGTRLESRTIVTGGGATYAGVSIAPQNVIVSGNGQSGAASAQQEANATFGGRFKTQDENRGMALAWNAPKPAPDPTGGDVLRERDETFGLAIPPPPPLQSMQVDQLRDIGTPLPIGGVQNSARGDYINGASSPTSNDSLRDVAANPQFGRKFFKLVGPEDPTPAFDNSAWKQKDGAIAGAFGGSQQLADANGRAQAVDSYSLGNAPNGGYGGGRGGANFRLRNQITLPQSGKDSDADGSARASERDRLPALATGPASDALTTSGLAQQPAVPREQQVGQKEAKPEVKKAEEAEVLAKSLSGEEVMGRIEAQRQILLDKEKKGEPVAGISRILSATPQATDSNGHGSHVTGTVLGDQLHYLKARGEPEVARRPATPPPVPQPEIFTRDNAFSTFSLNVADVSFKLAAASLEKGVMPDAVGIRSEEFLNAFDYRDPQPAPGVPVAFAWERAQYPFAQNRDALRFSVKTAAAGRDGGRPLNIVLVLDSSGSMERADRVQIVREALRTLAAQLQLQDKLSIVTFSRTARLWVDGVSGTNALAAVQRVSEITPEGGTNLEDAMDLAYRTALRHYAANAINRVVLLTDGAANLGDVEPANLKAKVEAHRKQGIALDCFGIGWEGYDDDLLEQLSRNGDGRYGFINSPEEAGTEFAAQLAGALRVAASDVKVQVEFNPKRVNAYRQIGYAKHQLTKEQFRDNTVDAAEIGASEAGNGLYIIETNPRGEGPIATVRVRFRIPGTSDYREHEWAVPFTPTATPLEQSSPAMKLAVSSAAFSEMLAGSPFGAEVTSDRLLKILSGVPENFGADPRPKKLEWMIRQAKAISGR